MKCLMWYQGRQIGLYAKVKEAYVLHICMYVARSSSSDADWAGKLLKCGNESPVCIEKEHVLPDRHMHCLACGACGMLQATDWPNLWLELQQWIAIVKWRWCDLNFMKMKITYRRKLSECSEWEVDWRKGVVDSLHSPAAKHCRWMGFKYIIYKFVNKGVCGEEVVGNWGLGNTFVHNWGFMQSCGLLLVAALNFALAYILGSFW